MAPVAGQGRRGADRQHRRLRHGRHELRRQRRPRTARSSSRARPGSDGVFTGHITGPLVGRREERRRRRRQHRLDRQRRAAARRPAERGRRARPRVLRPRRHGADRHRRRGRARLHRPGLLPRRQARARRRGRAPARSSEAVAEPLGFSVQRAAWAILAVANEHMVGAVREITINQGIDPRESIVVAGGGAGGLTMSKIAEELGCDKVLVPQTAAALSATRRPARRHRRRVHRQPARRHERVRLRAVNDGLADLDRQIDEFFAQHGRARRRAHAGLRRRGALPVPGVGARRGRCPAGRFEGQADVDALVAAFHETHERVFAVKEPGQRVECLYWKGRAPRAPADKPTLAAASRRRRRPRRAPSRARCGGATTSRSRRRCTSARPSAPGERIAGPAVVELPTTTVVVYPGWAATVTERGDYLLEREQRTGNPNRPEATQ